MGSLSATLCISTDLPRNSVLWAEIQPVFDAEESSPASFWGHESKVFFFSKPYAFKRVIYLHHKNVVQEKFKPRYHLLIFRDSYHCALLTAGQRFCGANISLCWTHMVLRRKTLYFRDPRNLLKKIVRHQKRSKTGWISAHRTLSGVSQCWCTTLLTGNPYNFVS